MNKYFINNLYKERDEEFYFDDTKNKDEWQNEVYFYAKEISDKYNLKSIVDYGCGSGFKLIKYFDKYNYLGLDLKKTIDIINKENFKSIEDFNFKSIENNFDITICADVIEHVKDPDIILNNIKIINSKFIILSTPDRSLLYSEDNPLFFGPPRNKSHIREWTFFELQAYLKNNNFIILDHFISNKSQYTQCCLLKIK